MIGKVFKTNGGGGGSSVIENNMNIFAQSSEPTTKSGIWINTSATENLPAISSFNFDGVEVFDNDYYKITETRKIYQKLSDIPVDFSAGKAAVAGIYIYLFVGKKVYRYNTLNDTYEQMTDLPYSIDRGTGVALVCREVYFFGTSSSLRVFKYDLDTGTPATLTSLPSGMSTQEYAAASIGSDIFIFGNLSTYEYDTKTDAYTAKESRQYHGVQTDSVVSIGTNIFLFGCYASASNLKYSYKYDSLLDTHTQLASLPDNFRYGSVCTNGVDIFIFTGQYSSSVKNKVYRYEISTNRFYNLTAPSYTFYTGASVAVHENIHLLGGTSSKKNNYMIPSLRLKNNRIYLFGATTTNTSVQYMQQSITHACICQNGELKNYPAYYGDGTQWNLLPA